MPNEAPWLSVVTVSLHEDDQLRSTLDSIDSQGVPDVEKVVVLGERPSDKLTARLADEGAVLLVQEPTGIYAAMNAGLSAANGTLVHFLNAGDAYASSQVLGAVRGHWRSSGFAWAYGRMVVIDAATGRERVRGVTLDRMRRRKFRGLNFPELPTVFMGRTMLQDLGGFDTSYRIAADYRALIDVATRCQGLDMGLTVARYALGGVSDVNWVRSVLECRRARMDVLTPTPVDRVAEEASTALQIGVQAVRRVPRFAQTAVGAATRSIER